MRKISRVIAELARYANAELGRSGWRTFSNVLYGDYCPNLYRVTELIPGISTKNDAIAKLGPPTGTLNAENQTILQWGGPQSPVHLAISFGMDNRMIQVVTDAQKLDQLSGVRP